MEITPNPSVMQNVSIDLLEFDPNNPRIPRWVNGKNETAVIKWMLEDATLLELMASIAEQGFFAGEPLLAIPSEHHKGKITVIEGNRRLSAVKLLHTPELAQAKQISTLKIAQDARVPPPETLPTLVYQSRDEILDYLGYRHITGIKAWDPLSKAKYLSQLAAKSKDSDPETKYQELAKIIGSRASYVATLLTALALYEKMEEGQFFGIKGVDETDIDFSLITTALGYKNIVQYLGLTDNQDTRLQGLISGNLKELIEWMFRRENGVTRLGESRKLRQLSKVVSSRDALKAFRGGIPLDEAALLTDYPIEVYRNAIDDARGKLQVAQTFLARANENITEQDIDNLRELKQLINFMYQAISANRQESQQ